MFGNEGEGLLHACISSLNIILSSNIYRSASNIASSKPDKGARLRQSAKCNGKARKCEGKSEEEPAKSCVETVQM